MPHVSEAKIVDAITKSRGLIAVAARSLGVSRRTLYNRMKKSEAIREAVEEARDFTTDTAEAALFKAIQAGEAWAVCFYLKTQGKDRGYVEKQQVEHSGEIKSGVMVAPLPVSEDEWKEAARVQQSRLGAAKLNGSGNGNGNGRA